MEYHKEKRRQQYKERTGGAKVGKETEREREKGVRKRGGQRKGAKKAELRNRGKHDSHQTSQGMREVL